MSERSEPFVEVGAREIVELAEALAASEPLPAVLRVVERAASERMQLAVFSAARCMLGSMELERVFSSRPDIYPVGARKTKRETGWAQQVLVHHQVFVGEGALEMAAAFDDQEKMASVGIRSIINIPVVVGQRCVAVLAFGRTVERVSAADVLFARFLGIAVSAAFAHASR